MFFLAVNSYGENKTNDRISYEIKSLIEKVKNAPPEEKYKYMNQLKIIIRNLHSEDRKKVMKEIVEELKNKRAGNAQNHFMKEKIRKKEKFHKFNEKFNERNINRDRLRDIKRKIKEKQKRRSH